ncbi:MAG: Gfo/Idh/MocA family protein [Candidatus Hydrogenedentota bacterium]
MTTDKSYRAGVIGAGAIAQTCHMPGYDALDNVEFAAFADPAKARHKEITERYRNARGYTDYKAMLANEALDAVSVCSPNVFHAEQTIAAFEAGCHVLCEKPMAVTLDEAGAMLAAGAKAKRKLMIAFTNRLTEGPLACKQLLKDKAIGKPFMIRVRFAHGGPSPGWAKSHWFYNPELSAGGALFDMGIHAIDLCNWLIGPIRSVSGLTATLVKDIEVEDNALVQLEFKNKALGYIEVGWTSRPGFVGFEIYGPDGSIICDYDRGLTLCGGTLTAGQDGEPEWTTLDRNPTKGGWDVQIKHWLDVIEGREKLTMDGQAGRAALEAALAAYESSKTGQRITLAE